MSRRGAWLAGPLVLLIALRLPYAHVALGVDEGGLAYIASRWGSAEGSLYGAHWLDRPPLLLLLFRLAEPGGELGIRLLGAVAAAAVVVLAAATAGALAGRRAARVAAVLSTALTGSVAIMAVYAPAELPAAVPSAAAVLCLVGAHRTGRVGWWALAGALATTAPLIKQSFIEAAVAVVVLALAAPRPGRGRRALAVAAGMCIPPAVVAGGLALGGHPVAGLPYALLGFRVDALDALGAVEPSFGERLGRLAAPILGSGLVLVVPLAAAGLATWRGEGALRLTCAAWLAAAGAGVLAGGSYWAHYLVQLVAPGSVLAAIALARAGARLRTVATGAVVAVVAAVNAVGVLVVRERPPQALERAAATFVRDHARAGDTQYVLYARANVLYYVGLPSPYPYHWSLMLRTIPGAAARLHALLDSAARPTWVLQWQAGDAWALDPHGRVRALLRAHYRRVAPWLCGRSVHVWLRRGDARALDPRPRVCPPFRPKRGDTAVDRFDATAISRRTSSACRGPRSTRGRSSRARRARA